MTVKSLISVILVFALSLTLGACGGDKAESVKLQGAGASFPAPLYLKWFKTYSAAHPNVQVDYQSVGSGSGVKSFMDRTVDFGASDAAMKPEDMAKVDRGVQLLPMTAGSIVLAHSLKDIPNLKLSREAYVGIFSGKITKWNDPAIAKRKSRCQIAGCANQRDRPGRQQRHYLCFHKTLKCRQPRVRQEHRR